MHKIICFITLAAALASCSTTRDGLRLGTGPSDSEVARIKSQIVENAQKTAAKRAMASALTPDIRPGIVVIGETGVLKKLDPTRHEKNYREFAEVAEKWHPGTAPYWTEEDYFRIVGGWTTLEIFSIPGLVAQKLPSAVPKNYVNSINFASVAGAWLVNSTKDLVVARSNEDGIHVIETVLCSSERDDYSSCASHYIRGQFDAVSGAELDRNAKIKEDGLRIDALSFKKI